MKAHNGTTAQTKANEFLAQAHIDDKYIVFFVNENGNVACAIMKKKLLSYDVLRISGELSIRKDNENYLFSAYEDNGYEWIDWGLISDSLLNEVELMQIVDTVFSRFGICVCIKINNRKILSGIAEIIGEADKIVDITVAIDKLDKIGLDNVNAELKEKGISDEAIAKLQPIILLNGTNVKKLGTLKEVLSASEVGLKGVEESEFILNTLETMGLKNEIELDLTLARGLNYYTGAIFEVKALDVQIGSITGGGRYDNLTGVFGMSGVSGVGISFGADRIFDVLNQLELYPKEAVNGTEVLFINFGEKEAAFSMGVLAKVRAAGIRAEIFPDASKMKKQMSYANAKNIPFVAIVGENEMNEGKVMLKNMETGEQNLLSAEELIAAVKR